jgi:thioredoxin-dependent peroxiredoxin
LSAEDVPRRVEAGERAPDFVLPDQAGNPVRLSELLRGHAVVLYFYPRDGTPGCTLEARAFEAQRPRFAEAGATVVGVSSDSVNSHRRFAAREHLAFPLLSDRDGAVRRLYGVEEALGFLPGRATYVIDPDGIVRHVYSSWVRPTRHPDEALAAVRGLERPA